MTPLALIRARSRQGIKAPRRQGPLPPYPRAIEREFEAFLRQVALKAAELAGAALRSPLASLAREHQRQDDAATDAAGAILRARVEWERWIETVDTSGVLAKVGEQMDLFADRAIRRQLPAVIPLDAVRAAGVTDETLSVFTRSGVDLIQSIGEEHFDKIAALVSEGFQAGRRAESIAKQLRKIDGVTKRRAEFIARDQVGKLNGLLQEKRQRALGGETYIWRSSKDSRVRHRHAELDGTVQRWDDPPILDEKTGRRGHPGSDFQCRCRAELDVDSLLSALEAEDVPPVAAAEVVHPLAALPQPVVPMETPAVMQFVDDPLGLRRPLAQA